MPVMFFSAQAKRSLAVRIGAPVVIWILALVANLLTVPPTPSHAFLPCDARRPEKVPLCSYTKVLIMLAEITKIFTVLVLASGTIGKVLDFFQVWNGSFEGFHDAFLKTKNCHSVVLQILTKAHKTLRLLVIIFIHEVCNKGMHSNLVFRPMVALNLILDDNTVVL